MGHFIKSYLSNPWWIVLFAPLYWMSVAPFLSLGILLWPRFSFKWADRKELIATTWWIPTIIGMLFST